MMVKKIAWPAIIKRYNQKHGSRYSLRGLLRRLYIREGKTHDEIGVEFGVSRETVAAILTKSGIVSRPSGRQKGKVYQDYINWVVLLEGFNWKFQKKYKTRKEMLVALYGECGNHGTLPTGAGCNVEDDAAQLPLEERCSGFYCFGHRCSTVCEEDSDCPEGMLCRVLQCSNVEDTIKVCWGDERCDGPSDCDLGDSCWPTHWETGMEGWCRPN